MHQTIEDARQAIKQSVNLLQSMVEEIAKVAPIINTGNGRRFIMAPELHQTANTLARLCLDASKKVMIETVRPCDEVAGVRRTLHDFGFVTELLERESWPEKFGGGESQTLLIALDPKIFDIWKKYNLTTSVAKGQNHPYLVGWLIGYPTNSITGFWEKDIERGTLFIRYCADLAIYREEFGASPVDSVGFNWVYDEPA